MVYYFTSEKGLVKIDTSSTIERITKTGNGTRYKNVVLPLLVSKAAPRG